MIKQFQDFCNESEISDWCNLNNKKIKSENIIYNDVKYLVDKLTPILKQKKFKIINNPIEIEVNQIWYGKSDNEDDKHFIMVSNIDEDNLIISWISLEKRELGDTRDIISRDVMGGFLVYYKLTDLK